MAVNVSKEPLYVIIYGPGSEVMHASNYGHHIGFHSGRRITFHSIRHPKAFSNTVRLMVHNRNGYFYESASRNREGDANIFARSTSRNGSKLL